MLPGIPHVLADHRPEFERYGLGKAVVNIIEGARIDVVLALPAHALGVERDLTVKLHPRHVDAEQLLPNGVALGGRHFGLFIHDVLEVVNHRAVGNERQRAGEVAVEELFCVGAKKAVCPRLCEKLHGHRVDLAGSMLGQM